MVGVHILAGLERAANRTHEGAVARHRQEHVIGHRTDVAPHAHGDNHAVAERLVQVVGDQAGDGRALGVGLTVIDGDQRAIQLEALDQGLLQLVVHGRMLQHAHLDNALIACTLEQATDLCA